MAVCQYVCETKHTWAHEGLWNSGAYIRVLTLGTVGSYLLLPSASYLLLQVRGTGTR